MSKSLAILASWMIMSHKSWTKLPKAGVESRDDLTRPETNGISKVPQLPPDESMPRSSGDKLKGFKPTLFLWPKQEFP